MILTYSQAPLDSATFTFEDVSFWISFILIISDNLNPEHPQFSDQDYGLLNQVITIEAPRVGRYTNQAWTYKVHIIYIFQLTLELLTGQFKTFCRIPIREKDPPCAISLPYKPC